MLEQLLRLRARRLHATRPLRVAKRPAQPLAEEKQYVADLRRLVNEFGEVTKQRIIPHLDVLAKARVDDAAPQSFNEFVIFSDTLSKLTNNDVLIPLFEKQAARVSSFATHALADSIGIKYSAFLGGNSGILAPRITDFVGENIDLIRTLSKSYVARVGDTLFDMQGARVEDISKALQYDLDVTKSHADLIAVDQTLKLNSQMTEARQTQVGITTYAWMTAHDERVRPDHQALDGTYHDWADEPPVVDTRTGRREHPGRDFRCRCQAVAVVPGFN